MNTIEVVAICVFNTVVAVELWLLVKLTLSVLGKTSVDNKHQDEKFDIEWFCYNLPIHEKNGHNLGVPALEAFYTLACQLQMPANQIEKMLGRCIVFGESMDNNYKDAFGREYTVRVTLAMHKKPYAHKAKKGLN